MARVGKEWIFSQLGGKEKQLFLTGWSAPFGRPRQGAVVRTPIRTRTERTYYPGNPVPTRHIFGHKYDDWELKGRFRDRDLGRGGALAKVEEVKAFVADAQPVRIAWGDILAFDGFIDEFDPGYEAETEIEWTLRLSIDSDAEAVAPVATPPKPPQDAVLAITKLSYSAARVIKDVPLPGDILDTLDTLLSNFTGAVGQLRSVAEKIQSFKDSTFGQISRAVSAVSQLRTAGIALRETFVAIPADIRSVRTKAVDIIKLQSAQATVEEQMMEALGEGANIERSATLAVAGRAKATYIATTGDTWESISTRFYSTPGRANDIRDANSVRPGQQPVPGAEYMIPK